MAENNEIALEYERGDYFKEHSHPTVVTKVVVDTTDDLHGEPGYRLVDQDVFDPPGDGEYYSYWQPARHLHDEVAEPVQAATHKGQISEEKVQQVEEKARPITEG